MISLLGTDPPIRKREDTKVTQVSLLLPSSLVAVDSLFITLLLSLEVFIEVMRMAE